MTIVCIPMLLIGQLTLPPPAERELWFRAEYAQAAEKLRSKPANVRGSFSFEETQTNPNPAANQGMWSSKSNKTIEFNTCTPDLKSYSTAEILSRNAAGKTTTMETCRLECFRGKDWFRLHRGSEGEPWRVSGIGEDAKAAAQQQVWFDSGATRYADAPLRLIGGGVEEYLDGPNYKLVGVDQAAASEGALRIQIEDTRKTEGAGVGPDVSVVVLPLHQRVVSDFDIKLRKRKNPAAKRHVDYDFTAEYPTPTRINESYYLTDTKFASTVTTVIFREFEYASTPANEFTLAYYGIPAANAVVVRGRRTWPLLIIAVVAVGLPALAFILKFLARWWIDAMDRSA